MEADLHLMFELGKYVYNGGVTGVAVWLIYDVHILKQKLAKTLDKVDVQELVETELALVKQEQLHIKQQLDRIENKIDDMRDDLYHPIVRK